MNITQLKNKVKEVGEVRAYWAVKNEPWDIENNCCRFGFRGTLKIGKKDDGLELHLDDVDDAFYVNYASHVHAPCVGHYSFGK